MVMTSPFFSVMPPTVSRVGGVVDAQRARARDAGLAHAARDHRRVRGHAAARGQNALGRVHAVDVFGAGLDAHQDHPPALAALSASASSAVNTISPDAAPGEAGRPVAITLALGVRIDGRMQQLIERGRIDPRHRLVLGDEPFVRHFDRDAQRGLGGALAGAGLQHPELALLDGEFEVLHVAVVALEQTVDAGELAECLGHRGFHARACRSLILRARLP